MVYIPIFLLLSLYAIVMSVVSWEAGRATGSLLVRMREGTKR